MCVCVCVCVCVFLVFCCRYREAEFCEDFEHRSEICARTWLRPYPQEQLMDIVPLGATKTDWNFECRSVTEDTQHTHTHTLPLSPPRLSHVPFIR